MNIGILGPGGIAHKMAETIQGMEGVHLYGVASRSLEKAQAFQQKFQGERAYGSYEEMVADPAVDLVYVATPHSHHYPHARLCLEHGKHVLCEKAFTFRYEEAQKLVALSQEKQLFLGEAIWTRYLPSRSMIQEVIASGKIGEAQSLTANMGYALQQVPRLWDKALAGGAMLDLSVYAINFARMVFSGDIVDSAVSGFMTKEGVDAMDTISLTFQGGEIASLHTSALGIMSNRGTIFGTKGYLEVTNINNPEKLEIFDGNRTLVETIYPPAQLTGFEYQVQACVDAIKEGKIQADEMPHQEILLVMKLMDDFLQELGYFS